MSKGQLLSLEKERSELAAKLDELHSVEEGIVVEYSEMISEWEQMIHIEQQNSRLTKKLAEAEIRRETLKSEIESSS
jgi:vacuolar-type H+-ATPase subunit I/STV1